MNKIIMASRSGQIELYRGNVDIDGFFSSIPEESLERVTATAYFGILHVSRWSKFDTKQVTEIQDGVINKESMLYAVASAMSDPYYSSRHFTSFHASLRKHEEFSTAAFCGVFSKWKLTVGMPLRHRILNYLFSNKNHVVAASASDTLNHALLAYKGVLENLPEAEVCPSTAKQPEQHVEEYAMAYLFAVAMRDIEPNNFTDLIILY